MQNVRDPMHIIFLGVFGLTYLRLSIDISICEIVWESLRKQLMTCP